MKPMTIKPYQLPPDKKIYRNKWGQPHLYSKCPACGRWVNEHLNHCPNCHGRIKKVMEW